MGSWWLGMMIGRPATKSGYCRDFGWDMGTMILSISYCGVGGYGSEQLRLEEVGIMAGVC